MLNKTEILFLINFKSHYIIITGLADIISFTVSSYGWHCLHYYYYYYYYYYFIILSSSLSSSLLSPACRVLTIIYPVSRVYIVAAVLYLQFVLHVMLFRPWNMFCTLYTSTFYHYCYYCYCHHYHRHSFNLQAESKSLDISELTEAVFRIYTETLHKYHSTY